MHIRAARDGDLPGLIDLFRETVHTLGAAHYTRQELAAWAPDDLRPEDWSPRLTRNTALVAEELEARARDAGIARLTTNASRVAKPFFLRRGFALLAAQTVERRGVAIENFAMEKILDA
jgi:putative acetyltransferase